MSDCIHFTELDGCIHCSPKYRDKAMMVLACAVCSQEGGQTWHVVEVDRACCAKCGAFRSAAPVAKDIGISKD